MKIRKLMSLVLALMLVLSMIPAAFAAEEEMVTEAYLYKTYNTVTMQDFTFGFTATQTLNNIAFVGKDDDADSKVSLTIEDITVTPNKENGGPYIVGKELVFGTFKEAGIYQYTVKENDTAKYTVGDQTKTFDENANPNDKLIMSQAEYIVEAYVEETDENKFELKHITVKKTKDDAGNEITGGGTKLTDIVQKDDGSANGFNFTNTYVYNGGAGEPDPDDPDPEAPGTEDVNYDKDGSFKLGKTVTNKDGTPSDTDEFEFDLTFTYPTGTNAKTLNATGITWEKYDKNGDKLTGAGSTGTLTSENTSDSLNDVILKNGEYIKFKDMPAGTVVNVTENKKFNYRPSYAVVMDDVNTESKDGGMYGMSLTSSGTLGQKTNTIQYTNLHLYIPATGVILNILPFVLMVALAGGVLFLMVYSKRRRA